MPPLPRPPSKCLGVNPKAQKQYVPIGVKCGLFNDLEPFSMQCHLQHPVSLGMLDCVCVHG